MVCSLVVCVIVGVAYQRSTGSGCWDINLVTYSFISGSVHSGASGGAGLHQRGVQGGPDLRERERRRPDLREHELRPAGQEWERHCEPGVDQAIRRR